MRRANNQDQAIGIFITKTFIEKLEQIEFHIENLWGKCMEIKRIDQLNS